MVKIISLLLLGCIPTSAQAFDWYNRWNGAGKTWQEKWSNTLNTIEELPISDRIEMLGKAVELGGDGGMSNEKREVFTRGQQLLLAIPGHAKYYQNKIEAMRAEVLASAGKSRVKSEEELRAMQDSDESEASEWTYLSYCETTAFPTLALLPSAETVAVLGHFLEDPQGRDGKTLLGNPMNGPDQDYSPRKTTAECAAIAIRKLGIEHPPARPPAIQNGEWAPPAEIDAWKDWWHEVKAGQRTYRFTGSPTEYGPDGPVTAEKLQAIERDRKRDDARAAGHDGPAVGGAAPATGAEHDGKPSRTPAVLIAAVLSIAAVLWYFLRMRKGRPA